MRSLVLFLNVVVGARAVCRLYAEYDDGYYYNITELGVAAVKNDVEVIDDLISTGCDPGYNGTGIQWISMEYVNEQDEEEYTDDNYIYSYDDLYKDDNFTILYGESVLHIAVNHASVKVVEKLVATPGVNVNVLSGRGETPLNDAASFGFSKILRILVAAGADLEKRNNGEFTPLHSAIMYRELKGVKTLIELGANVDAAGGIQNVPALTMAVQLGFRGIVKELLEAGADMNAKDNSDKTAMEWADIYGDKKMIEILNERKEKD